MKIAVLVAMDKELRLLLPLMQDVAQHEYRGMTYHTGTVGRHSVTAAKCGIGKVNAALRTRDMLEHVRPELVINTGVAGGAGGHHVLDVIAGARVAYHDTWCGPDTREGEVAGCPRYFTPPQYVLDAPALSGTVKGLIASGDRFIATPAEVAEIRRIHPDVDAVDMESAAIAHACHMEGVPFFALRVLSDTPGDSEDNLSLYTSFWDDAPQATFETLSNLLHDLR